MLKFLGGLVLFAISATLSAYTLMMLWAWFLVPLGVASIGMVHAYGLSILIKYATMQGSDILVLSKNKEGSGYVSSPEIAALNIVLSIVLLGLGFTAAQFM